MTQPATTSVDSLDTFIATAIRDRSTAVQAIPPLEPEGVYATPEEALEAFYEARRRTLDYLAATDLNLRAYVATHPIGMDLDAHQWFLFLVGHVDRHLQQIAEVKNHSKYPT